MADYTRGWRSSHSRSPYFKKMEKQSAPKPPGPRLGGFWRTLWKVLLGIFSFLWLLLRWLLHPFQGFWKKAVILAVLGGLVGFIFLGLMFAYYSFNLPDPNRLADRIVPESTKIFDRNQELLYEIHGEAKRTLIKLADVPTITKQAFIAIEDKDFYKHGGVSLTGIVRSVLKNLFTGSRVGGSTITQQFVRNAILTREKTYTRKFKEIVISLQLERRYSKDEILQLYLNEIPFGSNAYGIEAASQTFFGKDVKNLNLVESAYLAALPQAPTFYSPYGPNRETLRKRANTILGLMYEQGYITKDERNRAQNQNPQFRNLGRGILAPHFVLYVQDLLAQKYGEISLQEGGLKVTTTLDLTLQKIAEEAVAKQVALNEKTYNAANASLVAVDPQTGQILAMVGSRDYFDEERDGAVNVALRPRQPGSSFKPYVYATAFKQGMNPATMLIDVVTNFGEFGGKEYTPQNYDGKEHGPVSIRQALQGSLNIPAVKTLILVGVENAIDTAEALGITTLKDRSRYGPSLVLGGGEVKLLEHTSAFGVFATGGIRHEPVAILRVEDKNGQVLEEYRESRGKEVLDPQIAYEINHILSDNDSRIFIFGANNRLTLPGRRVAAKTGTTQEYRDAWTIGYTPSLAVGVWVGNNDNSSMKTRADGSVVAAPIWNEFMRRALEGKGAEEFPRPDGILELAVDSLSGKLPSAYTPSTKTEIFASFNAPREEDDLHLPNGVTTLHSEKPNEPNWEEPVKRWAEGQGYTYVSPGLDSAPVTQKNAGLIKITSPETITALPWQIKVETERPESNIELFLDNIFLGSGSGKVWEYESRAERVDGAHQLLVQVKTPDNSVSKKTVLLNYRLNRRKVVLLVPQDNQELPFPNNLVVESSINIAPENAKFYTRTPAGKVQAIAGNITKRQLGQIYQYTLGWNTNQKPASGSYTIYAQIGNEQSQEVIIKVP